MRAAVPEELDHFDLLAFERNRLRRLELRIFETVALRRRDQRRRDEQREKREDLLHAYCCSFIFTRLASMPFCASAWRTRLISSTLV